MTDQGEQQALIDLSDVPAPVAKASSRRRAGGVPVAETDPIVRVALDLAPAHLDRTFDYLVPAAMSDDVRPGVRVKARFGAQDLDGYVLARSSTTEHDGALQPLRRLVSAEPVLTPEVARLCRAVADRYAGTMSDVLRLAVPRRHARAEAAHVSGGPGGGGTKGSVAEQAADPADPADPAAPAADPAAPAGPAASAGLVADPAADPDDPAQAEARERSAALWNDYGSGAAFVQRVAAGGGPRAVWTALAGRTNGTPGVEDWAAALAGLVRSVEQAGRGVLVVLPDARDVDHLSRALDATGWTCCTARSAGQYVRLEADDGPSPRYRSFLAALRGDVRVVVGTRAAAFAPVQDLGLVVCWSDDEETHADPRAPYPHVREVLRLRSELEGAAWLVGSHGRSVVAQSLLASGWAREITAARDVVRRRAPRVRALTSVELASEGAGAAARLPTAAWRAARAALEDGPVLVQVPRRGYLPVVACARCRTPATCGTCHGPLGLTGAAAAPQCTWCGRLAGGWRCDECHGTGLRSVRVGSERTAEELGRAFPGVTVRQSGATAPGGVLATVPAGRALVVATPGAEPVVPGGYAAALLLDAAVSTAHVGLAVTQAALHRWLAAAALVRPAPDGGQVLLVGDAAPAPTNALVRWDPAGLADRELTERAELDLPPAVRVAAVTGDREAVRAVVARVPLATATTVLGPVDVEPEGRHPDRTLAPPVRVVVRVPAREGDTLANQLSASLGVRSARREGGGVRVRLDPEEML
ncbi:putative primosomal protein N' [Paraoerskovia sediminicola]|uniref:Probable replication restart protein PriA n=1 Tax=Paraoerskovia sediminicola TaxID=1138587 RepID=A0ABN6XFY6_9CELL|nr:primosomal protein N' [Paraoerskovia sediminicola]BDZ43660.1 putative primosomal protein N' [Paraoerskovia sediminicola]